MTTLLADAAVHEIRSPQPPDALGERLAVNSVMRGTTDVIKVA